MVKDYKNGKIYRIFGGGKQYVGSTTETLSQRLSRHRGYAKDPIHQGVASVDLLKEFPDAKIELLEDYPCNNNKELTKREQWWIDNIKGGCVNKIRANTPIEIKNEQWKQRYEKNKEHIQQYKHDYFQENYEPSYYSMLNKLFEEPDEQEERLEQKKNKKRETDKNYRENNRDKIHQQAHERYINDEDFRNRMKARAKAHRSTEEAKQKKREYYQQNKEDKRR
jgi:hypothetical protein